MTADNPTKDDSQIYTLTDDNQTYTIIGDN